MKKKFFYFLLWWGLGSLFISLVWAVFFVYYKNLYSWIIENTYISIASGNIEDSLIDSFKQKLFSIPQLFNSNKCSGSWYKWEKLDKVLKVLDTYYYSPQKLDIDKMRESAIKWLVSAIWDPFTVYLTKQENAKFSDELKWDEKFEGIWAVVTKVENWIMIEQVFKNYPAYKAGLKPLDIIIKINWQPTKDLSLAEAVSKIRGPAGTKVKLTIFRPSENKVFEVEIVREKINIPSVMGKIIYLTWNVKVGYINVSIIWTETSKYFEQILKDLNLSGAQGYILDLRWNWGGFLNIAVDIASHFIPKGKIIVKTKYRLFKDENYYSFGYWDWQWKPIVVLIDWLTASAAEIISAALKEDVGAKLVGEKTFGKCTIQTLQDFSDGSALKYTIGKWFTPKGFSVCSGDILPGRWLIPDVEVKFNLKDFEKTHKDLQLEKAKEILFKMLSK